VEAEEERAVEAMRTEFIQTRVGRPLDVQKGWEHELPGLRPFPRIKREALRKLLESDNNRSRLFEQLGPVVVTDALVGPDKWGPLDPACRDGHVTFGHQVLKFLRVLTQKSSPADLKRIDEIAWAAHNKSFDDLLETLGGSSPVPEYQAYLTSLQNMALVQGGGPRFPDLEREIERYVRMPLSAHDVPLATLCPGNMQQWTPASLLDFDSGFPSRSARVFWGPKGSQPYPLHTNEKVASGPIMKFVASGRQEVAIFPRSEAGKLLPLFAADATNPRPTAVFRVDALGSPDDAAHYGDFANARGWKDEVKAGELLIFMGRFMHQFKNPVESFSLIYLA
jgi:hypothetical protein